MEVEIMKYVITGGPCSGKSTLLGKLENFNVIGEAARVVIEQELAKQSADSSYTPVVPWVKHGEFQDKVIEMQEVFERDWYQGQPTFLDRSLIDVIAYSELGGDVQMQERLLPKIEAAGYGTVFLLELLPWVNDSARKESPEQAKKIHEKIREVYERLGCDVVQVPANGIEYRMQFVLEQIDKKEGYEVEKKFPVESHNAVKQVLDRYCTKEMEDGHEVNKIYSVDPQIRLRNTSLGALGTKHELTVKGNNTSDALFKRLEVNIPLVADDYYRLVSMLPAHCEYKKYRRMLSPVGDSETKICLDDIPSLGKFVEIESASERQVLAWQRRLGLQEHLVQSYAELIRGGK